MKVKIHNTIYDSTETPILLLLSKEEIVYMQNMADNNHKYCSFPDDMKDEDIDEFMDVDDRVIGYVQY